MRTGRILKCHMWPLRSLWYISSVQICQRLPVELTGQDRTASEKMPSVAWMKPHIGGLCDTANTGCALCSGWSGWYRHAVGSVTLFLITFCELIIFFKSRFLLRTFVWSFQQTSKLDHLSVESCANKFFFPSQVLEILSVSISKESVKCFCNQLALSNYQCWN